jgi:hypothetical protein
VQEAPIVTAGFPLDWLRLLVFAGAALGTLVASVMADEQNLRLRNGAFGTVAGGFVGALMALLTKQDDLVVIGFFGSTFGAFLGWVISLGLSFIAAKTQVGRTVLEYQIGGWQAVRDRLSLEEREPLLRALKRWTQNFARVINRQTEHLEKMPKSAARNQAARIVIEGWLVSIVEIVDLLFELGKRPGYRSRVTVIVYGRDKDGKILGRHWIADSGRLPTHKTGRDFDEKSIGYQVLSGSLASPYFTTGDEARAKGQDRGEQKYRPFLTFRVNSAAVLAVDWPSDLNRQDPFVQATEEFFQLDVIPAVAQLLDDWEGQIQAEVGLNPV